MKLLYRGAETFFSFENVLTQGKADVLVRISFLERFSFYPITGTTQISDGSLAEIRIFPIMFPIAYPNYEIAYNRVWDLEGLYGWRVGANSLHPRALG